MHVGCLDASCDHEFSDEELKLYLPSDIQEKYTRLKSEHITNMDPLKIWCPNRECSSWV